MVVQLRSAVSAGYCFTVRIRLSAATPRSVLLVPCISNRRFCALRRVRIVGPVVK